MKWRKIAFTLLFSFACALRAGPLPFDVSYPEAAVPGEKIAIRFSGKTRDRAVTLQIGDQSFAINQSDEIEVRLPDDLRPYGNLAICIMTQDGENFPLPSLALVPASSAFGRNILTTRNPPFAASSSRQVALPVNVPFDYYINGAGEIQPKGWFAGTWPARNGFFLRGYKQGNYTDPQWFFPVVGRDQTFVDYGFDPKRQKLFDRWGRWPETNAGQAIRDRESLPFLQFPNPAPIKLTAADLPAGPLTLSFWVFPRPLAKLHFLRSSTILTVGIDASGFYYASRSDENRSAQTATASRKIETHRWQHLAATFDGLNLKLYIDGDLVATRPCSGRRTSTGDINENLGSGPGGASPFHGEIAAHAVYNRALPASTIRALALSFQQSTPKNPD